jgi:hypothetical protein
MSIRDVLRALAWATLMLGSVWVSARAMAQMPLATTEEQSQVREQGITFPLDR